MPWHIEQQENEFCVVKDDDRSIEGCHPTEQKAQAQLAALNIAEQERAIAEASPRLRLSGARTPSYNGTETLDWAEVSKTWENYRDGYYKFTNATAPDEVITQVGDAPAEMRGWIASKSLLGDSDADTFEGLVMFPVVNPNTDKLNAGAVRNAISRAPQANISEAAANSVQDVGRRLLDREFSEERASLDSVIGNIYAQAWDRRAHIHDIQVDDGALYVVLSERGKLYRVPVAMNGSDGMELLPGIPVQVRQIEPRTIVFRQADGRYRWIGISATAVLNRIGEIDSRALLDSFIEYAERTGEYPVRMFYHAGEAYRTGQADFLARDGYCYITSGVYDTPLGEVEARARMREPEYWGDSIGYIPTRKPEIMLVGGVELPVYTEGINREISTLPIDEACNWFTRANILEEEAMSLTGRAREAFLRLFGGDETRADEWLSENVDELNRMIESDELVTRADGEPEPEEQAEKQAEEQIEERAEPEPEPEVEIVLDDDARDQIISHAIEQYREMTAPDRAEVSALLARVAGLETQIEQLGDRTAVAYGGLVERVTALEQDEAEKLEQMADDLPRKRQMRVTYRPRDVERDEKGLPMTADELARQEFQKMRGG